MIKKMRIKDAFKEVIARENEEPETTEAEDVQEFANWLDAKIAETLDIYMGIIEKYDPNTVTVIKKVIDSLEGGVVNVEEIWDETDFIGSFLKFYNKYNRLISRLPDNVEAQIIDKVDTWMSRYFNMLI